MGFALYFVCVHLFEENYCFVVVTTQETNIGVFQGLFTQVVSVPWGSEDRQRDLRLKLPYPRSNFLSMGSPDVPQTCPSVSGMQTSLVSNSQFYLPSARVTGVPHRSDHLPPNVQGVSLRGHDLKTYLLNCMFNYWVIF